MSDFQSVNEARIAQGLEPLPDPLEIQPDNPAGAQVGFSSAPTTGNSPIPAHVWEAAVGSWVRDHVRNSPIASATEAWNHLMGILPHLKARLETELKAKE